MRFLVQHGSATRPPSLAEGQEFLTHDRLVALLAEATAVVCHGGPGTIMDAREAGHVPLCVPRDPRLGEHVDGHQQRFAAMVGQAGVVHTVATLEEFHDRLDSPLTQAAGLVFDGRPTVPVRPPAPWPPPPSTRRSACGRTAWPACTARASSRLTRRRAIDAG